MTGHGDLLAVSVGPDDHVGGAGAAFTVAEYADFGCPYRRKYHEVLSRLRSSRGEGCRFVFGQFPLADYHPYAGRAAAGLSPPRVRRRVLPGRHHLRDRRVRRRVVPLSVPAEFLAVLDRLSGSS